eukprot:gene5974-6670_t
MAQYKGASREGHRAQTLIKRREKQKEEMELMKNKLQEELSSTGGIVKMSSKFNSHFDAVEHELKSSTIGLVTLDEMKAKQEILAQEHEKRLAIEMKESKRQERKRRKEKEKLMKSTTLSFDIDEDEEDGDNETEAVLPKRIQKNPNVDTSFLPDRQREEEEQKLRENLRQEWTEKQERIKQEEVEITYSYWDGSGHRRTCRMTKGDTIQKFLQKCLMDLRGHFTELRACGVEHLMYVKEDLIIPHHYTFYDFIVTKARGKSGPLFSFDAREDIRLVQDASVEKDESHAGKVVLRSWYEKNKHIFPASRWEAYDPEKKWEKFLINKVSVSLGDAKVKQAKKRRAKPPASKVQGKIKEDPTKKQQSKRNGMQASNDDDYRHESSESSDEEYTESDEEQEDPADYCKGGYHVVKIGDLFSSRYHVIRKLGWGHFSTVWLSWDLFGKCFVALKIVKSASHYTETALDEMKLLQTVHTADPSDLGYPHVVQLLDNFKISGIHGTHVCMVFEVLGYNLLRMIIKSNYKGIPISLVKSIIKQTLQGLNYLHTKCKIIHTDIKPENILVCITGDEIQKLASDAAMASAAGKISRSLAGTAPNYVAEKQQQVASGKMTKNQKKKLKKKLKKQLQKNAESLQEEQKGEDEKYSDDNCEETTTTKEINDERMGDKDYEKMSDKCDEKMNDKCDERMGEKDDEKMSDKCDEKMSDKCDERMDEKSDHRMSQESENKESTEIKPETNIDDNRGLEVVDDISSQLATTAVLSLPSSSLLSSQPSDVLKSDVNMMNVDGEKGGKVGIGNDYLKDSCNVDDDDDNGATTRERKDQYYEDLDNGVELRIAETLKIEETSSMEDLRDDKDSIPVRLDKDMKVKIADLGNACWTNRHFTEEIQTRQYRSVEVLIGSGYGPPADIWSTACMAFELVTGDFLFEPHSGQDYSRDEDHIALIVELLGRLPKHISLSGKYSREYFTRKGELKHIKKLRPWCLRDVLIEKYEWNTPDAEEFASFIEPMLDYVPERRATAAQCLKHPWLNE